MKNRMQKYLALISVFAMLSTQALAAELFEVTEDFSKNQITVSGTGIQDEKILFQILKKGKSFDGWQKGFDPNEYILWQGQMTSDGSFSFTVPYDEDLPAGTYQARVVSDMRENMGTEAIQLVGTKTYSDAVLRMQEAAKNKDYQSFQACIDGGDQDVSPVGFDLSLYKKLIGSVSAEQLLSTYRSSVEQDTSFAADKVFDETAQKERNESFQTFMLMEALKKSNTVTDLKSELSKTQIVSKEQTLWKDLESCLKTDAEWTYFQSKLEASSAQLNSTTAFRQQLINALVLTETRYADGNDIQNVLDTLGYGASVGISTPSKNSKVYSAMSGKDYANIDAFLTAYKGYVSQYSESGSSSSSGSSGGSSKGSSGSSDVYYPGKFDRADQSSETKNRITVEFVDIEGISWAQEAIIALADKGILSGKDNGYFDPDGSVTREEFAKILVCAAGYENESYTENHFADVSEDAWYCKFVNIAYENGLVHGTGDGNFGVGMQISRQDMAVMICNALSKKGTELPTWELTFADSSEISEYARSSVSALVALGAVSGVSETEFSPLGNATRAQAAKIIYGVLEKLQ